MYLCTLTGIFNLEPESLTDTDRMQFPECPRSPCRDRRGYVRRLTVMLAEFLVSPEEAVSRGLLEAERRRDAAVDLRRGVLPVEVHLLGRHPVHVEFGEVDRVVHLQQSAKSCRCLCGDRHIIRWTISELKRHMSHVRPTKVEEVQSVFPLCRKVCKI